VPVNSATVFAFVLLSVVFVCAALSAVSLERALRLLLWEKNWWLRLSGLRAEPLQGDVEHYIAERKTRVRITGIIAAIAAVFFARLVLLQAR
jgi:hypothetical protein